LANFKLVGTIPVESEALNMVSSCCDTTFIINFKITTGTKGIGGFNRKI
jgi:hypothetical protein